jgi:hypothetical protein
MVQRRGLCRQYSEEELKLTRTKRLHLQDNISAGKFAQNLFKLGEENLPVNTPNDFYTFHTVHTISYIQ